MFIREKGSYSTILQGFTKVKILFTIIQSKIKDGDKISPGIAIAYLMFKKNLKLTIASLSVFQKRSCVEIEKWIYTQLLNYIPNQKEKEKK